MTPAARVQAAIECLEAVVAAARDGGAAADTLIARYFSTRRYAGSGDRRAVRELVYDVIRAQGDRPGSGRAAVIGYASVYAPDLLTAFGGDGHAPAMIGDNEAGTLSALASGWLIERFERRFGERTTAELTALLGRAPLDLRVNTLRATRADVLVELPGFTPTPYAPDGLRATAPFAVEASAAFREGRIEIQDEGSQLAALACGVQAGMIVVDLCAGAGGKTLALAAAMANVGRLIAADTDRGRLDRLAPRAARAGVSIIDARLLNPGREWERLHDLERAADVVLIDAPCSGTGTWRRNPEARWRLTTPRLDRLTGEQARLLDLGSRLVKPGGRLTYVVCSLLPEEGEAQIAAFGRGHSGWRAEPLQLGGPAHLEVTNVLTPLQQGCDGFYVASLTRL